MIPALIFAAGAGFLVLLLWQRYRRLARERYIRQFALPRGLYERLRKRRPELELKDCALVARGLRQFFLAYLNSGCRFVAMPSQAVDDLWHEFILYTRAYEAFAPPSSVPPSALACAARHILTRSATCAS